MGNYMGASDRDQKPEIYTKYPAANVILYNTTTILHFLIGGFGIFIGYNFTWLGYHLGLIFGLIYIIFAFVQMYLIMPLTVCPNCVYYKLKDSLCTSGMNLVSRKIAKEGNLKDFKNRAGRPLSHNKLYMGALIIPIAALVPALIINFSLMLLMLLLIVIGLFLFRMLVVFRKTACAHCRAKKMCPNAQAMGLV
jgi:hypothetical protein